MKEKTIKDITYLLNERNLTASVIRKKEYAGDIIIPKTVVDSNMSYRVTSIGDSAFEDCSSLMDITISDGITSVGKNVFAHCSSLTAISIPKNVKEISTGYEVRVKEIFIGLPYYRCEIDKYTDFHYYKCEYPIGAFHGCSSLTTIIVDHNNPIYDSRENCNAIIKRSTSTLILGCENTIIPNSVTSIGKDAFEHCSSLTAITFKGTIEQWKKIMLYSQNWEPTFVIHCTDGDIS